MSRTSKTHIMLFKGQTCKICIVFVLPNKTQKYNIKSGCIVSVEIILVKFSLSVKILEFFAG